MNAEIAIEKINPARAEELLERLFEGQRPVTSPHVERMANEMKAGQWHLSPDCLLLVKGKLANGQHRMLAVCRSKTTQQFIVMRSNDEELYKYIDAGRKRTVSDVIQGEYANVVATIARNVVLYDLQILTPVGEGRAVDKCTRSLCIEFAQTNHEVIIQCARFCKRLYTDFNILSPAITGTVMFLAQRDLKSATTEKIQQFITNFYDGNSSGDAARDCRDRVLRSRIGSARLHRFHLMALLVKSFKSYVNGTRLAQVKLNPDESFPRFK